MARSLLFSRLAINTYGTNLSASTPYHFKYPSALLLLLLLSDHYIHISVSKPLYHTKSNLLLLVSLSLWSLSFKQIKQQNLSWVWETLELHYHQGFGFIRVMKNWCVIISTKRYQTRRHSGVLWLKSTCIHASLGSFLVLFNSPF